MVVFHVEPVAPAVVLVGEATCCAFGWKRSGCGCKRLGKLGPIFCSSCMSWLFFSVSEEIEERDEIAMDGVSDEDEVLI